MNRKQSVVLCYGVSNIEWSLIEEMSSMKDEFRTYQGRAEERTWEERLVELKDSVIDEFRRQPVNMICMAIFLLVLAGLLVWWLGNYFPTFDPSRY